MDVTLVSALRGVGIARAGSATRPGAALKVARRRKERTYPELAGEGGRARLVLAGEVGGRWSAETASFLTSLAQHKAQGAPVLMKGSVEVAWRRRWAALLACARRSWAAGQHQALLRMSPLCMRSLARTGVARETSVPL